MEPFSMLQDTVRDVGNSLTRLQQKMTKRALGVSLTSAANSECNILHTTVNMTVYQIFTLFQLNVLKLVPCLLATNKSIY